MNRDKTYLTHILDRIERLEDCVHDGKSAFMKSVHIQDAAIRNFEVIGEAAKRLSQKLKKQHPQVPWKRIAGFRDILIHQYERIVPEEVWAIIDKNLPNLKKQIGEILNELTNYQIEKGGSELAEKKATYNKKRRKKSK